ncbi:MAG TPA: RNA-protein complex protein Nop10 [Methanocorpusculum sp.]|nr:RNA-protein complex protein Nop10 [Methanocorpusculum sp.]
MKGHIRRCPVDKTYTLLDKCHICGADTVSVHPARYSPEDRYGKYRRMTKSWNK